MKYLLSALCLVGSNALACVSPDPFIKDQFSQTFVGLSSNNELVFVTYSHPDGRWLLLVENDQGKRCLVAKGRYYKKTRGEAV